MSSIRRITWLTPVLLWTAFNALSGSECDAGELVEVARARLDQRFNAALEKLIRANSANTPQRRAARIHRDPSRQYFYVPPSWLPAPENQPEDPETADPELERLTSAYAGQLYQLVRQASGDGQAGLAFRWAHEVLRYAPAHLEARRIVGLPSTRTPTSGLKLRRGKRRHPKTGWAAGQHIQIDTAHFRIASNGEAEAARSLAQSLEQLHATWRQVYFDLWSSPAALRAAVNGRRLHQRQRAKHQVMLFRNREQYLEFLRQIEPQAQLTLGYYHAPSRIAFFYGDDQTGDEATWRHEATHQLFHEVLGAPEDVGDANHFWIVEGAALYMESLQPCRGYVTLGGLEADRLQFARYRALREKFYEPLERFAELGRSGFQQDPRIRQLYSQSAGLTHFLMDFDAGRYRPALTQYLKAVYQNRADRDLLARLAKASNPELDMQYFEFLKISDDDLRKIEPSASIRNLAIGNTDVGDMGLQALPKLDQLIWLDLKGTRITDNGTQGLTDAVRLRQLNLEDTSIGDRTVQSLSPAVPIEELDLSNTRITDASLPTLGKLRQLRLLWLTGTDVSDQGLLSLHRLSGLETLDVSKTQVTPRGWSDIQAALPGLK